jgi:outer membrane protein OmpA-like peptidoglycan-associated protein
MMRRPIKAENRVGRWSKLALVPMALLWLCGCSVPDAVNPVAWYRDVTGASKSDNPDQPNQKNLEQGNNEPYPNLADVPDAPESATSTIDRQKLEKSLVADRENAKYSDQQLIAGQAVPGFAAPPSPPPAAPQAATPAATESPPAASNAPAAEAAAASTPAPPAAPAAAPTPAPTPAPVGPVAEKPPTPPPAAPATAAASATVQPLPPTAPPAMTAAGPSPVAQSPAATKAPAAAPHQTAALPKRGSEAPPQESSLVSPTVPSLPQGQTPPPPPPLPNIAPVAAPPQVATAAAPKPVPVPAVPKFGSGAPSSAIKPVAAAQGLRHPKPTLSYEVAEIKFGNGSAAIEAAQSGDVGDIVKLHKEDGGSIRVIGYAERTSGADAAQREIESFSLALQRAQAVANALEQQGIATADITVEAAPARAGKRESARAEIYFER